MMMIRILDSGSTVWNFEIFGLRRMYALGRLADKCPVSRKFKKNDRGFCMELYGYGIANGQPRVSDLVNVLISRRLTH